MTKTTNTYHFFAIYTKNFFSCTILNKSKRFFFYIPNEIYTFV